MGIALDKFTKDGKKEGTVDVSEAVFGVDPNTHVMHLALRRELANGRAGTANSKTRGDVRGGGKKPWKQKGTGRARAGSTRSPLWVGGGVIFGPKPRDYSFDIPRKVRRLAIKSSLSSAKNKFRIVQDFSFLTSPKTKEVAGFLKGLSVDGKKVLILADYKADENKNIKLGARNLEGVRLRLPENLSVKDIVEADIVVATQSAVEAINERYASDVK